MSLTVTEEVAGAEVVEGGVLAVVVGARVVDGGINVMEDCPLAMVTMATKMGTMNNAILLCKARISSSRGLLTLSVILRLELLSEVS